MKKGCCFTWNDQVSPLRRQHLIRDRSQVRKQRVHLSGGGALQATGRVGTRACRGLCWEWDRVARGQTAWNSEWREESWNKTRTRIHWWEEFWIFLLVLVNEKILTQSIKESHEAKWWQYNEFYIKRYRFSFIISSEITKAGFIYDFLSICQSV